MTVISRIRQFIESGNYTQSGNITHSGTVTQSGAVTFTGTVLHPLTEMTTSTLTLTEAAHAGHTILVTSGGSTSTHCTITLPAASGTAGATYTIASGITGTPTSRGIYVDPAGTDTISTAGAGLGLKSGTSAAAKAGASVTLISDGTSKWILKSRTAAQGGVLTNCWVTT